MFGVVEQDDILARLRKGIDIEQPVRLKIGQNMVTRHGDMGKVRGVGVIDYAPHGPGYEVVELEMGDGRYVLAFAVDLHPDEVGE